MNDTFDEHADDEEIIYVSKSELKRDSKALQELGSEIVKLPEAQLARIPLPDNILEAIQLARSIKARGGLKRQLQYIGKLLRNVDAEPIEQAMEKIRTNSAQATARLHRLEQWRDRLIDGGDEALGALLEEAPQADRQHLRQLIRNAQKELAANKPPKSARELFRYLRELFED